MGVLAIIPARAGSQGIPNKNWKRIGVCPNDDPPAIRACNVALDAGCDRVVLSTDHPPDFAYTGAFDPAFTFLTRPPELAADDTPMIAVVQHVLEQILGQPDQKIVLLQPTQPLREPKHIQQALGLLTPEVDSVVSVVELPKTHHPDWQCVIRGPFLYHPANDGEALRYLGDPSTSWRTRATRRQELEPTYIRDGTCYAFWRKTLDKGLGIYGGSRVKPLIVDPSETCGLDTEADWAEAERRLKERDG